MKILHEEDCGITVEIKYNLHKHNSSKDKKEMLDTAEIIFPSGSGIWDDSYSQELEDNINVFDAESEMKDITVNFGQDENADPSTRNTPQADNLIHQVQGKNTDNKRKETNASTAVQLMREQMKIKQAKLKVFEEKISLKKQKFEFRKKRNHRILKHLDQHQR